jgi:hypothetical protein
MENESVKYVLWLLRKFKMNEWNDKRSLRKASSVGNFDTIKDEFKEIYYSMFEQGKRFLSWNSCDGTFLIILKYNEAISGGTQND